MSVEHIDILADVLKRLKNKSTRHNVSDADVDKAISCHQGLIADNIKYKEAYDEKYKKVSQHVEWIDLLNTHSVMSKTILEQIKSAHTCIKVHVNLYNLFGSLTRKTTFSYNCFTVSLLQMIYKK